MSRFVSGQRWLSQTEPELGLGLVLKTEEDRVTIVFPSTETTRVYTMEGPPLTRVKFSVGDLLKTQDNKSFVVEQVDENGGRVLYWSKGRKIDESRLSDSLTFSKPYDRLLNAQVEEKMLFNLRHRALYRRFKTLRAPLRGMLNGRFTPRAHQLHVVTQITRLQYPRVLLCDESGMGKTIEMGLIIQRMLTLGHGARVLLLAPADGLERVELELSRRFDLHFERLNEDDFSGKPAKKTVAKKAKAPHPPFASEADEDGESMDRWVSMSLEDISAHRGKHAKEAAAAGWDAVVVAGAETLTWDEGGNAAWNAVEALCHATKGIVLMSSHGPEHDAKNHFGRLHLIDPEAFSSPRKYTSHRKELEPLEHAVIKLMSVTACDRESDALLKVLEPGDPKIKEIHKAWKEGREESREYLIDYLLDAHECGRSVFRCTRTAVTGLPERIVKFVKLETKPEVREGLKEEFKAHKPPEAVKGKPKPESSVVDAPAAAWLAQMVNPPPPPPPGVPAPPEPPGPPPPPPPRALIIVTSRARAVAVEKILRHKVDGTVELVTDGKRADQGLAPRVIVTGAEDTVGRTFPGMDVVILWDTPLTATEARERLFTGENSIANKLTVYVPVVDDTPQELTARWLHEGVQAFTTATEGQEEAAAEHARVVHDVARRIGVKHNPKLDEELKVLTRKTATSHDAVLKRLEKHRDVFLERLSFRAVPAEQAHHRMVSNDDDESLDTFMNKTLETLGILVETKGPRVIFVKPNPESHYRFEEVPKDGMTFAYHRSVACIREDAHYLTWDHPILHKATERLLSTPIGNTAYVVWEDERAQIVLLEGIYLARPKAGPHSHIVSRYMPPTPVRVVVTHEHEDLSAVYTSEVVNKMVRNGRREWIRNNARPLHNIVPGMVRNLTVRAQHRMTELAAKAAWQMETVFAADIARLRRLPETKSRKAEIKRLEAIVADTKALFEAPSLVMDQLRLLRRGPSGKGI